MKKKYDWLIVGSGLFGATFAYLVNKDGKRCLVIDKRDNFGGNVWCQEKDGIIIHKYGCHIFHTSNRNTWDFVNKFTDFTPFVLNTMANYNGELYNLPFNMNTFTQIWDDVKTPQQAAERIKEQSCQYDKPVNLEEQAINLVGVDVYNKLIRGYTEKQWGVLCKDLPSSIIKRLPVRYTFNNNYFDDTYQGIPRFGYNALIDGMLNGIEKKLRTNFLDDMDYFFSIADRVLYTGPIDELFNYRLGALEYRTVRFCEEEHNISNYQGCAVMNFTSINVPYTRIIEHKHFDRWCKNKETTIITKEYSTKWKRGIEPYYPIGDKNNIALHKKYLGLSQKTYGNKIVYGGRLGDYQYYDMDDAIENAINLFNKIYKNLL